MRYVSTRGQAPSVGFVDALLGGLAPDGGLYAPQAWPTVPAEEIAAYATRPYAEVAADILGRFAGEEIAADVLRNLCAQAYASFTHAAVAPLTQLAPGRFLLELFHGPTLAFKDVAMQILARLYDHALAARGRTLTIVCATSGDTGGAAVEAFAGRAELGLVTARRIAVGGHAHTLGACAGAQRPGAQVQLFQHEQRRRAGARAGHESFFAKGAEVQRLGLRADHALQPARQQGQRRVAQLGTQVRAGAFESGADCTRAFYLLVLVIGAAALHRQRRAAAGDGAPFTRGDDAMEG